VTNRAPLVHTVDAVTANASLERSHDPRVPWMLRLRWGALFVQAASFGIAVSVLGMALPLLPAIGVLAGSMSLSVVIATYVARRGSLGRGAIAGVLAFDVLATNLLLYLAGGPANPFSVLHLVHVTLAAVVLGARAAYGLAALATAGYGLLFFDHVSVPMLVRIGGGTISMHLVGMWIAFALSAALVAHFVGRASESLASRDAELAGARDRAARSERLAAVATLAAGAAHELATPLATIAIVAGELAEQAGPGTSLAADAALLRDEVARCRAILDQLSYRAGEPIGEVPAPTRVAALLDDVAARLPAGDRVRVTLRDETAAPIALPRVALAQALVSLVRNALEAQPASAPPVEVVAEESRGHLRLAIADHGPGMDATLLARVGEPFFTTKGPGRGLGLGLFLARSVAEQLGGRLELDSQIGRGTRVVLTVPARSGGEVG
jgi:two-component system sensor histidine kinase RegB